MDNLTPEDESTMLSWNIWHQIPSDVASHHRRMDTILTLRCADIFSPKRQLLEWSNTNLTYGASVFTHLVQKYVEEPCTTMISISLNLYSKTSVLSSLYASFSCKFHSFIMVCINVTPLKLPCNCCFPMFIIFLPTVPSETMNIIFYFSYASYLKRIFYLNYNHTSWSHWISWSKTW